MMKTVLTRLLAATVMFGGMTLATEVFAQRGGGPGGREGEDRGAEFQRMMMDRLRERFEVKDDAEWKLISERLGTVMELRRSRGGGFAGGRGFGGPRGGRDGGPEGEGRVRPQREGDAAAGGDRGERPERARDRGDRGGRPGGEPNPALADLEKALESDASAEQIKEKLNAVRASRKADEEKLKKAQTELREVLSFKQEARAVLMGFLD